MLCRAVVIMLAVGTATLPDVALGSDIKPKIPETAFTGKLHPDILGLSTDSTAESARAIFDALFKGRSDAKTDIQQQKFGGTTIGYIAALNFSAPSGAKQLGEVISSSFSSPASANRAYFIARNITFAQDQQPAKADMIKEIMDKYGSPTIVGDQHLYYIYRKGSIISAGAKYKEASATEAIDKPLEPRIAVKLNGETVRGSCVAVVKRSQVKEKTLDAMLSEAKGANCDGVLSVQAIGNYGFVADRPAHESHTAGYRRKQWRCAFGIVAMYLRRQSVENRDCMAVAQ